jgi:transposase
MEDHKSEIANWDLGAGIYISFYSIKNSFQDDTGTMSELVRKLGSYINSVDLSTHSVHISMQSGHCLMNCTPTTVYSLSCADAISCK